MIRRIETNILLSKHEVKTSRGTCINERRDSFKYSRTKGITQLITYGNQHSNAEFLCVYEKAVCRRVQVYIILRFVPFMYICWNRNTYCWCSCVASLVIVLTDVCMFIPEDIIWFKPVELKTKCGLKGHIKEPLGILFFLTYLFLFFCFSLLTSIVKCI